MSAKKKNTITLLVLSAVLVICLVLYFVIPRGGASGSKENNTADKTEEKSDSGSIRLDSIPVAQIDGVTVEKKGKKVWSLKQKKKNSWILVGQEMAPVNKETVTAILGNVNPVTATQKFDAESVNLSAYGLGQPALTISIKTTQGKKYQYQIGSEVPKSDIGYYAKCSDREEIYCINSAFVKAFDVSATSLLAMDELPELKADDMTAFAVKNKAGKDFVAKKVSDAEKVDFYSNWNITAPYAKPLATSQSEWSTVLGNFTALKYEEMVAYNSNHLKQYGLSKPKSVISVTYQKAGKGDDKSLRLCIGKKSGESYYVCEQGKKNVYKMSASSVENITGLDAYTNMDHCVYSVLATSIKGYDVTYGDTTLKVTRKSVPKKNSDTTATPTAAATESGTAVGNETDKNKKNIWTLNGKKIPEDKESDFLSPYSLAYLLEYSGKAEKSVKPESREPVLTIVYHENNRDVTVKYLPYDGINFYRVEKNGMDYFLVDKLSVDDVIEAFRGIEKLAK